MGKRYLLSIHGGGINNLGELPKENVCVFEQHKGDEMSCKLKLKVILLFFVMAFAFSVSANQLIDLPSQNNRPKPGYFEKQGYPRNESAERLDADVRQLLDGVLRLYRESGLFTNRKEALKVIGAIVNDRVVYQKKSFPEKKRLDFREDFLKEGIFSRPGWSGLYLFSGQPTRGNNEWYSQIRINIDSKTVCIDSRAVEGYLDLVLDPGLNRFLPGYVPPERIFRHEVSYASPWVSALFPDTPSLILEFGNGCLRELLIAGHFSLGEIDDEAAYN